MTSAELRAYGREQAQRPEWGPEPPLWHTALVQADWEAEAYLLERGSEAHERRPARPGAWRKMLQSPRGGVT